MGLTCLGSKTQPGGHQDPKLLIHPPTGQAPGLDPRPACRLLQDPVLQHKVKSSKELSGWVKAQGQREGPRGEKQNSFSIPPCLSQVTPKGTSLLSGHELRRELDHPPTQSQEGPCSFCPNRSSPWLPFPKGASREAWKSGQHTFQLNTTCSEPRGSLPPQAQKDPTWISKQAVGVV